MERSGSYYPKAKFMSRWSNFIIFVSLMCWKFIQTITSYVMSVFLLPRTLCEELELLMNRFWWVSDMDNKGIRWICWDKLCYPKKFGGMGFWRIREFNIAMLGKQAWRLLTEPQSFIAKLMQARYYPSRSFKKTRLRENLSYVWRSILETKELLETCSRVRVGSGESINIWNDSWIPYVNNECVMTDMVLER